MTSTESRCDPDTNLGTILGRIHAARETALAPAATTYLVAISKGQERECIEPILSAGHRLFGENRVQEAKSKWPPLKAAYPDTKLHLVGPLQTNKTREAVALFDAVHSLDRPSLAQALVAERERSGRCPDLFVQVNTGEESQKSGVDPTNTVEFASRCRDELGLPVVGLMCIPPLDENPALHFALLQKLAQQLSLQYLSMGMSDDFETAIRFGATHVRIGTALFGTRS